MRNKAKELFADLAVATQKEDSTDAATRTTTTSAQPKNSSTEASSNQVSAKDEPLQDAKPDVKIAWAPTPTESKESCTNNNNNTDSKGSK